MSNYSATTVMHMDSPSSSNSGKSRTLHPSPPPGLSDDGDEWVLVIRPRPIDPVELDDDQSSTSNYSASDDGSDGPDSTVEPSEDIEHADHADHADHIEQVKHVERVEYVEDIEGKYQNDIVQPSQIREFISSNAATVQTTEARELLPIFAYQVLKHATQKAERSLSHLFPPGWQYDECDAMRQVLAFIEQEFLDAIFDPPLEDDLIGIPNIGAYAETVDSRGSGIHNDENNHQNFHAEAQNCKIQVSSTHKQLYEVMRRTAHTNTKSFTCIEEYPSKAESPGSRGDLRLSEADLAERKKRIPNPQATLTTARAKLVVQTMKNQQSPAKREIEKFMRDQARLQTPPGFLQCPPALPLRRSNRIHSLGRARPLTPQRI